MSDFNKLLADIDKAIKADPDSDGAFTSREAQKAWSMTETKTRRTLAQACDAGLLDRVHTKKKNAWGQVQTVMGYRPVKRKR